MEMPLHVQFLVDQHLEAVRSESSYTLRPFERLTLYRAFGPSRHSHKPSQIDLIEKGILLTLNLTEADKAFAWLATITARQVLSIWEQSSVDDYTKYYSCSAARMIEMAEGVLENTVDANKAYEDLYNLFYFGTANLNYFTTQKVFTGNMSAYAALEVTLLGIDGLRFYAKNPDILDEKIGFGLRDFAAFAACAYSAIDENKPGAWETARIAARKAARNKESAANQPEYTPITFDPQRRLEFWEWWLTEAIPQAWGCVQ